jgi:hypothetical protein
VKEGIELRTPKPKKAGDKVIWLLNDNPVVLDFLNKQSNIADALRFVVESFVEQNGEFDIATVVPKNRDPRNPSRFLRDSRYNNHHSDNYVIQQKVVQSPILENNTSEYTEPAPIYVEREPIVKTVLNTEEGIKGDEFVIKKASTPVKESGMENQTQKLEQDRDIYSEIKREKDVIKNERTEETKGEQTAANINNDIPAWLE